MVEGNLEVDGHVNFSVQTSAAAGTDDTTAEWDGSSLVFLTHTSTQTFNLGAAGAAGRMVTIKVKDTSNNARTINTTNATGIIPLIGGAAANISMKNSAAGEHPEGINLHGQVYEATIERAIADMLYFNPFYHFDRPIDVKKVRAMQEKIGYPTGKFHHHTRK